MLLYRIRRIILIIVTLALIISDFLAVLFFLLICFTLLISLNNLLNIWINVLFFIFRIWWLLFHLWFRQFSISFSFWLFLLIHHLFLIFPLLFLDKLLSFGLIIFFCFLLVILTIVPCNFNPLNFALMKIDSILFHSNLYFIGELLAFDSASLAFPPLIGNEDTFVDNPLLGASPSIVLILFGRVLRLGAWIRLCLHLLLS